MPTLTTLPRRLALRVLSTTVLQIDPRPIDRCTTGPHRAPYPPAAATVVVVLEPATGDPGVLTLQADLCAACLAALPAAS